MQKNIHHGGWDAKHELESPHFNPSPSPSPLLVIICPPFNFN